MYLIFDTETTGLPKDYKAPVSDTDNWPRCIQIAWQLHDEWGGLIEQKDFLIKPDGFDIPFDAEKIHGISTALAENEGVPLEDALDAFAEALQKSKFVVGQNVDFDVNVVGCELYRLGKDIDLTQFPVLDTCTEDTANLLQLPGGRGGKFKLPTLTELHEYLFNEPFAEAHNATADVEATTRCFLELIRRGNYAQQDLTDKEGYLNEFIKRNSGPISPIGLEHVNLKKASEKYKEAVQKRVSSEEAKENLAQLADESFAHLHNHTQYSILQSTTEINALIDKAIEFGLSGVALTDTGNMMAAFNFVKGILKYNNGLEEDEQHKAIKPIVGCELQVCEDRLDRSRKDNGYQVPILAKSLKGYRNLSKICSQGWIDGFYYVPRVDKKLIAEHKEDLIVTTGGVFGEIPGLILNVGEAQAEEALLWWKAEFGDDFYIELNRHGLEEEERVNEVLLRFAKKHNIKYFAANNNFYIDKKDAEAHDILLCVKDGERKSTPIGRGRGFRFGMPNDEYYLKSPQEMKELFKDLPEAITCTNEIANKVTPYKLESDVLLPKFDIPEEFKDPQDDVDGGNRGENAYLRHLTYVGAEKRYGEITDEIKERLDFELSVIENTGYPGYFLIVQDFTGAARDMGVSVGPGRGSAAGSAVAYCIGITNVDPIAYDLLFERFLNPDRVSMPDIDIDFDDEGRGRVIQYVIDKYGASQVAQIITYGTMAAKSSIRDTARALDLPLSDADRIAKLVPDMKLNKLFNATEEKLKEKLNPDQLEMARNLKAIAEQSNLEGETVKKALVLEGSVRNTGIHACGVIITPSDIREHIPVAVAKDSDMWCTQFDNSVVEDAGLLKMDFLGLKTLTLIKDAIAIVKERHNVDLVADDFPLDDAPTYELFQRGETVGIFQYESAGMQKYMKELKPTVFADLIAMNALYRPGPLEYIPSFIRRKHGEEPIAYDLDDMQEYLEETYGITVYQEQVMLLSQKLANFTKGEADMLRKAMGKKIFALLEKLKPKFIEGGKSNGHAEETLLKVWKDWEAFAAYAFNKSHSTCYAWVAYQTAYLKAHYPAEYMASVLSNNMNDIKSVTFFMEECRRMGVPVLGPDVNESGYKFTVNAKGEIRFGLGAIKGVGGGAVENIVDERKSGGPFVDIFDFAKRVNLRNVNKRCFENLAKAGGFDCFSGIHRAQYFFKQHEKDSSFLEKAVRFGLQSQNEAGSAQQSIFGEGGAADVPKPLVPQCEPWSSVYELNQEKEMVGIYISGHPLDDFKLEMDSFCNFDMARYNQGLDDYKNKELSMAGVVSEAAERMSKRGEQFGIIRLEDYTDGATFFLFGETYLKFRSFLVEGAFLYLKGKVEFSKYRQECRFNITSIELLPSLREKMVKGVTIQLPITGIDKSTIESLERIIKSNPGECSLKCILTDPSDRSNNVEMSSKSMRISLSNDFIQTLKHLPDVKMKFSGA
jgi:DNA polymerase-3 subunit alpha